MEACSAGANGSAGVLCDWEKDPHSWPGAVTLADERGVCMCQCVFTICFMEMFVLEMGKSDNSGK